jgi:carbon monoxide dehydrogenase subunit G
VSSVAIEDSFEVGAPPADVFAFLLDPERLVACLPGAELESVEGERVFRGKVRVKVGSVTLGYQGRIELTHVDAAVRRLEAEGEGREQGGAGVVRVGLRVEVDPEGASASRVRVAAKVALAGRIVRFGRGLVDAVSKELFHEFASAVRERVPAAGGPATPPAPAPIRAIPLLWRALKSWVRRLFGARV